MCHDRGTSCRLTGVLNAFRHHRGGHHAARSATAIAPVCAQRLSASQRWACSQRRPLHRPRSMSAQRLSASQRWACSTGRSLAAATRQCSTPFGITEVGIVSHADCRRAVVGVLNAFRHHRGGHSTSRPLRTSPGDGAQRLSASQRWACAETASACDRRSWCSTPFGITEVGIAMHRRIVAVDDRVLNAFRHHRGGHARHSRVDSASRSSAQRLSASQRWAYAGQHHRCPRRHECSTPFGITEVGMPRCGGRADCRSRSAQRLSASQRWAYRQRSPTAARRCGAQRLSASQRWACVQLSAPDQAACRCSTPFGITEVGIATAQPEAVRLRVGAQRLSASQRWASRRSSDAAEVAGSAQRLSASQRWACTVAGSVATRTDRCSTPFGITEVGMTASTWKSSQRRASAQRLSASQRWAYAVDPASRRSVHECSTPFGITEVGIQTVAHRRASAIMCSTPFGITEVGIRDCRLGAKSRDLVLNAFRHHRGGHQSGSRPASRRAGAQRLSASQRWACQP